MTTYYVDVAVGNDANLGTSEGVGNAWASFEKAFDTVTDGDLVYVKASGEYVAQDGANDCIGEISIIPAWNAQITFEGYTTTPGDGTFACVTLNAGTNALANCIQVYGDINNCYYVFNNFRFTGASDNGFGRVGLRELVFRNCRFDNNGAAGYYGQTTSYFYRCQVDNNGATGIFGQGYLLFCTCFSNTTYGAQGPAFMYASLFYNNGTAQTLGGSGTLWAQCVFDGNNKAANGIANIYRASTLVNSIIYNCGVGIESPSPGAMTSCNSINNILYENTTDRVNSPVGDDDMDADPLFTNPATNDYTLQTGSPALAAGRDASGDSSFMDIGAHQRQQATQIVGLELT